MPGRYVLKPPIAILDNESRIGLIHVDHTLAINIMRIARATNFNNHVSYDR